MNNPDYKIAICDDSQADAEYIATLVKEWAKDRIVKIRTYPSAEAFMFNYAEEKDYDILLLDIEMGKMDGVTMAKAIRQDNESVQIVFITGYSEYIADGYDVDALHYLIKPVKKEQLCAKSKQAVVITSNASHPAFHVDADNLHIIYQERLSLGDALAHLKQECGCERLTVQSGGTVNGLFLREKLLDYVDIVVAPVLIGGKDTPTLIDGKSLVSGTELSELGVLKLMDCSVLEDSYIRLQYEVVR